MGLKAHRSRSYKTTANVLPWLSPGDGSMDIIGISPESQL
nr:24_t:CDS:2 [Entrophospora candida]CAG8623860.1 6996_t:CDS:2 [Entrophospora candida]